VFKTVVDRAIRVSSYLLGKKLMFLIKKLCILFLDQKVINYIANL